VVDAQQDIQNQSRAFWKMMGTLGNSSWQRWFKTEKIGIALSPMVTILGAGILIFPFLLVFY
jgi:hypothetical protein